MNLPNPYFKGVPGTGELFIDYVILEHGYPVLFVSKDSDDRLYLCDCCNVYKEQRWLVMPITLDKLKDLYYNRITLKKVFETASGDCYVILWSKGPDSEVFHLIRSDEFIEEDLPADEFLDLEDEEFERYLSNR